MAVINAKLDTTYRFQVVSVSSAKTQVVAGTLYTLTVRAGPTTCLNREVKPETDKIHAWLLKNKKTVNKYGDAKDTMYTGGSPLFDETTGKSLDLNQYILSKHPTRPWCVVADKDIGVYTMRVWDQPWRSHCINGGHGECHAMACQQCSNIRLCRMKCQLGQMKKRSQD